MIGGNLSDYLWGDKKDEFTGFYGRAPTTASAFATDVSGRTRIPTAADLAAAEKPEDKLTILKQMADLVGVQADAAIATGRADNVAGMGKAASDMLASLSQVVDGLKTKDGSVADGEADPALKPYATQIGAALTSLRGAMDKIATLSGRTSSEVAGQVSDTLAGLDDKAGAIAKLAGANWRRSGTTFRPDSSKLVDLLV